MPTYEYECDDCKNIFEKFQGINDDPLTECTTCGGQVRRIIHGGAGLVFKGSGFYITDSRNSNSGSSPQKNNGSGSSCPNASESCSDSCPAAKKD